MPHYEWSGNTAANAAVVAGAAQGYLDAGYGSASTPRRTSGSRSSATSRSGVPGVAGGRADLAGRGLSRCGEDWLIQGGEAVLGQWVEDNRDQNVTCPGAERRLGEFFATTDE